MASIEIIVKPFSRGSSAIALEYGHVIDGKFVAKGEFRKQDVFMQVTKVSTSGQFGKSSYEQEYSIEWPGGAKFALAAKHLTGIGTTRVETFYKILFTPIAER